MGQAPLKNVINKKAVKIPGHAVDSRPFNTGLSKTTVKSNEKNLKLLNRVSSMWRTGNGKSQTPQCFDAIRNCLDNGIAPTDVAIYVAFGLKEEVQAMEFKRVKE